MRHHGHTRLEAGQAQGELRENDQRYADNHKRATVLLHQGRSPVRPEGWLCQHLPDPVSDDNDVQTEVQRHQSYRHTNGFSESAKEDRAQQRQQEQGDGHLMARQERLEMGVLD
jgi:hypothetical protein